MRMLVLGVAVAAANVALGRWMGLGAFIKPGLRDSAVQAFGFLMRAAILFAAAHLIWLAGRRTVEVAGFIVTAGLLQMAGHVWLGGRRPGPPRSSSPRPGPAGGCGMR